jgi:hypothetical protein
MEVSIKQGNGGNVATVDDQLRLHTQAYTVSSILESALRGRAYDIVSGIIDLTNDTENALLYVLNNEDEDIIMEIFFLDTSLSTGASAGDTGEFSYYFNPTGGTLISDASATTPINNRIGDPKTLDVTAYKATAAGKTLTGGTTLAFPIQGVGNYVEAPYYVIPKGSSVGVSYTPPASNTSQDINIGIVFIKNGFLDV